jgi:hypothetical protein
LEDILETSRSDQVLLTISHFGATGLSLEIAENLRKSRSDSRVVGAVVGAPATAVVRQPRAGTAALNAPEA